MMPIIVILSIFIFTYYFSIVAALCLGEYDSKEDFKKDLIPFGLIVRLIIKEFNKLS